MRKGKGQKITPKEIPVKQRKITREEIFAHNRRYHQLAQNTHTQNFKFLRESFEADPTYRTLIETLRRIPYRRNQIMDLAKLLDAEDLLDVYHGVVGLCSFGEGVVSREGEEEFLGSGVIPKLVQLAQWREHSFLQLRSLELLRHLAKTITGDNFRAFCNLTTIPFSFFINSLSFSEITFHKTLYLMQQLNERGRFIDPSDQNIFLLAQIDDVLNKEGFSVKYINPICRLLGQMKPQFWSGKRLFANKYYEIRGKILEFFKNRNQIEHLLNQMRGVYEKDKVKAIFTAINDHEQQVPAVKRYINDLVDICFQIKFPYHSHVPSIFINALISVKETRFAIPREWLFTRSESLLMSIQKDKLYEGVAQKCLNAILNLFLYNDDDLLRRILEREQFLAHLALIYECNDRKVVGEINSIVRHLLGKSFKEGVLKVLQKYRFIELYFKYCAKFNQLSCKGSLKYMMWAINGLKRQSEVHYELIRKEVVTKKNYQVLYNIKRNCSLSKMEDIFVFYDKLKQEENKLSTQLTIPEPDHQENAIHNSPTAVQKGGRVQMGVNVRSDGIGVQARMEEEEPQLARYPVDVIELSDSGEAEYEINFSNDEPIDVDEVIDLVDR